VGAHYRCHAQTSSSLHQVEGIRLHAARGVFRDDMHAESSVPVRGCSGREDAAERCWADGADRMGRIAPTIPERPIGRICGYAQPFPCHRHHRGRPSTRRGTPCGCPKRGRHKACPYLGDIIGAFKSMTTNEYIRGVRQFRWTPFPGRLWQRNYYEHIIRNEDELNRIRGYIVDNPLRWHLDRENPERVGEDEFDRWLDNLGGKT